MTNLPASPVSASTPAPVPECGNDRPQIGSSPASPCHSPGKRSDAVPRGSACPGALPPPAGGAPIQGALPPWLAHLLAFVSSGGVMVIELVAARLLAPFLGVSLYTWTSILGAVLSGMALGNAGGGLVADRWPSPRLPALLFIAGGLATAAILPLAAMVAPHPAFDLLPITVNFAVRAGLIFFLPSLVLSMVTPVAVKCVLGDLERAGRVVGTITAASVAGSILGTYLTGFVLVPCLGIRQIVWALTGLFLALGLLLCRIVPAPETSAPIPRAGGFAGVVVVLVWVGLCRTLALPPDPDTLESEFYTIRVVDTPDYGAGVKTLFLDAFPQNRIVPDNPRSLPYECHRVVEEIVRFLVRDRPAARFLHLGGGAYCLPRYAQAVWPESRHDVVEIDPAVTRVAVERLGLPASTPIRIFHEDARRFLLRTARPDEPYDLIVGDVFNDYTTPFHLTTIEFARLVRARLASGGLYLINVNDVPHSRYTPSVIQTLQQVFPHVILFGIGEQAGPDLAWEAREGDSPWLASATDSPPGRSRQGEGPVLSSVDRIIVASDLPFDVEAWRAFVTGGNGGPPFGQPYAAADLPGYLEANRPLVLTDDYAPTEFLQLAIFADRHQWEAESRWKVAHGLGRRPR